MVEGKLLWVGNGKGPGIHLRTSQVQLVDASLVLDHQVELRLGQVDDLLHLLQNGLGFGGGRCGALLLHG